ncbi:hypothetical protein [Streptomyces sp. NPDC060027]|uniref:hypothetical protein n=1 Tax=Streptomyces sp. NPDC060027 TaxID=3347040 RepID=UPI0036B6106D
MEEAQADPRTAGTAQAPASLADLRAREFGYLDEGGHTYLDHTGAGLPPRSLVTGSAERITGGLFGNPHSDSPASRASGVLLAEARRAVLRHYVPVSGAGLQMDEKRLRAALAARGRIPGTGPRARAPLPGGLRGLLRGPVRALVQHAPGPPYFLTDATRLNAQTADRCDGSVRGDGEARLRGSRHGGSMPGERRA